MPVKQIVKICLAITLLSMFCTSGALFYIALKRATLVSPAPTYLLLDRNGEYLAQYARHSENGYGYWPVSELPQRFVSATIALEDRRFFKHWGVDPIAVFRALWQNISAGKRVSGASTISMQVARMQNQAPRTYVNKAIEAMTAVILTVKYGREAVLKHYLQIVPYGNQGHGIVYAARLYLDKPVDDLSWAEIALLAAIPHAPTRLNPYSSLGKYRAVKRARKILSALKDQGLISKPELTTAVRDLETITLLKPHERPETSLHGILKVEAMLQNRPVPKKFAKDPRLYTTLDLNLSARVNHLAQSCLKKWKTKGTSHVAAVVLGLPDMEVLAWLGSIDYFNQNGGAIDFINEKRSPGSTLKPFIYALALENKTISPGTVLDDLEAVAHGISNADMQFIGPLLPRQALANSRNVPAVNLLRQVGLDECYQFFSQLGLHDNMRPARYYGYAMAIGSMPVDLESLVTAYGALANDGKWNALRWYRDVKTNPARQVMSIATARLITLFLSDPMARLPSFPRMGTLEYPFPVAIKTGTSQGFRDAWAIGYSKKYLVGVWTGRADYKPTDELIGAGSSAELVADILLSLHKDQIKGNKDLSFPPPPGYRPYEICSYTGLKNIGNCDQVFYEWFAKDQVPSPDDLHRRISIDTRNQLRAGPWTPKQFQKTITCIDLPPRYSNWARLHHIKSAPMDWSYLDFTKNEKESIAFLPPSIHPELMGIQPVKLTIDSPENGIKIFANPNVPQEMNTIGLRVTAKPYANQVLWLVDGKPYRLCAANDAVRWPLQKGRHTFQVKLPYRPESSGLVSLWVE